MFTKEEQQDLMEEIEEKTDDEGLVLTSLSGEYEYAEAIIGITSDNRVVYDVEKMIECIEVKEGWTYTEAYEWLQCNTFRAYPCGENSDKEAPIYVFSLECSYQGKILPDGFERRYGYSDEEE